MALYTIRKSAGGSPSKPAPPEMPSVLRPELPHTDGPDAGARRGCCDQQRRILEEAHDADDAGRAAVRA
jgi:hypothetical protein